MSAPDFVEPVVGWRAWRVAQRADGLVLVSAVYDEVWEPLRELVARCQKERHRGAPHLDCTCGIYAAREVLEALRHRVGRNDRPVLDRVVGEVALWGRVVEGERGWRAERAYPLRLWVRAAAHSDKLVAGLSRYGVPVAVEPEPDAGSVPPPLSFAR